MAGEDKVGRVRSFMVFPDVMPTLAELTGAKSVKDTDGCRLYPIDWSQGGWRSQEQHQYLYWELGTNHVRMGNWKAVRTGPRLEWQLFNLKNDIKEVHDVSKQNPKILEQIRRLLKRHTSRPWRVLLLIRLNMKKIARQSGVPHVPQIQAASLSG